MSMISRSVLAAAVLLTATALAHAQTTTTEGDYVPQGYGYGGAPSYGGQGSYNGSYPNEYGTDPNGNYVYSAPNGYAPRSGYGYGGGGYGSGYGPGYGYHPYGARPY